MSNEQKEKPEKVKKKKKKVVYLPDDGRTIYSMENVDSRKAKKKDDVKLSRKERFAMIRAAFAHYTPIFLMVLAGFTAAALLIYLWLGR